MAAMNIFLALCAGAIVFLVVFFVALCREGLRAKSGSLVRVGTREPAKIADIQDEWTMAGERSGIHVVAPRASYAEQRAGVAQRIG